MHEGVTLDQLRALVAVVDEGSFSAAARKLRRVQSAVSHAMAALERQLDMRVWDRSSRIPTLTDAGRAVLAQARRVLAEADALGRTASGLAGGLEPIVSICVDAVFPIEALVDLCREFARAMPSVELVVFTETLSAVSARVHDGSAQLAVVGPAAETRGLARHHITSVRMIPVASRSHPLAAVRGRVSTPKLAEHVQIVLSERTSAGIKDRGVLSPLVWRVVDLPTKHALLRGGLGWGNMPEHMVRSDLARGVLVRLRPDAWGDDEHLLSLALVHRTDLAAGPATRWMMTRLRELCVREIDQPRRQRSRARRPTPSKTASAAPSVARGRKVTAV